MSDVLVIDGSTKSRVSVLKKIMEESSMLIGDILKEYAGQYRFTGDFKIDFNTMQLIKSDIDTAKEEAYPPGWKHCMIHLDPKTGEMHSGGDHSVRHWIEQRIKDNMPKCPNCGQVLEIFYKCSNNQCSQSNCDKEGEIK